MLVAVQLMPGGWPAVLAGLTPAQTTQVSEIKPTTDKPVMSVTPLPSVTPNPPTATPAPTLEPTPTPDPVTTVSLVAVGDIILHQSVIDGGLVSQGNPAVYDYTPAFQYVKPIIEAADLACANYEGTLAGPPFRGYPFFCAPDEIADALFNTGFRVAWTANNHTLDRGLSGVIRTANVFLERGFTVIGTRPDQSHRTDGVVDVRGIKIGLMAYTFETIGTEIQKALNGNPMPAAADPLIDSFNPYRSASYERDLAAMIARSEALRAEGAELICLSLHWGNEYQTRSSSSQRKMAQSLADAGIELIIGHHPHVLQEISVLTSAVTGQPTLVFYSIGNFLHNMEYQTHNTAGYAQDAVIARVLIRRDGQGVSISGAEYVPTYVARVTKGSGWQHLIVPVLPAQADAAAYQANQQELDASLQRTRKVLGDSTGTEVIPVAEAAR
jgi:poly-gamma-glutamate synthesis protein (capsule biosynthesis protein)